MKRNRFWRPLLAGLTALMMLSTAAMASAAVQPLWVFEPVPSTSVYDPVLPPPVGSVEGACGAAVASNSRFYISDYYHNAVDVWKPEGADGFSEGKPIPKYAFGPGEKPPLGKEGYVTQVSNIDSVDGPCGLALDSTNRVYVNDYHRRVIRYNAAAPFGAGTIIAGQGVDSTYPTGVAVNPATNNVYVTTRKYVAVYDSTGAPVLDGLEPLKIGLGSLQDGYGLAYSQYPGTLGRIYVPDAGTNTVKIYDPAVDKVNPVATINGSATPPGKFISLRDAAVAIDRVSGDVYVVDNLQPQYTERPAAIVYVFDASGNYLGHLLNEMNNGLPVGIAVDNTASPTYPAGKQGLVYVTSGNTLPSVIYNYTPGAATTEEPEPVASSLKMSLSGTGGGTVKSKTTSMECAASCEESVPAGSTVILTATPNSRSTFAGWSGACSGNLPSCTIEVDEATSVQARFELVTVQAGDTPSGSTPSTGGNTSVEASSHRARARGGHRHKRRHKPNRRQHRSGVGRGGGR